MRTTVLTTLLAAGLLAPSSALAQICTPGSPENDCDLDGCTVRQGDCVDDPLVNTQAAVIRGP